MNSNLRRAALLVALLPAILAVRAIADGPPDATKPPAAAPANSPPKVLITISKETTRITGPLRKDGYVDYLAAENEIASKGVTPENNSAVLFWKAVGPREIKSADGEKFFRMLGIPPLPENGEYFVRLDKYLGERTNSKAVRGTPQFDKEYDAAMELLKTGMSRPWRSNEFPMLAAWLAANEKPLSLIVEASNRPRRFDPQIANEHQCVMMVLLPGLQQSRAAVYALTARAMLRTGNGKIDDAWHDLLACHRLARLDGQGLTLIDALIADAADAVACDADAVLLWNAKLSASGAAEMLGDLEKLPPMPKMADKIDVAERFMYLDAVELAAREGFGRLVSLARLLSALSSGSAKVHAPSDDPKHEPTTPQLYLDPALTSKADWNLVLRMGNSWFDRVVEAFHKPDRSGRRRALDEFDADLRALEARIHSADWKSLMPRIRTNPSEADSRAFGEMFVGLLLPSLSGSIDAQDRAATRFDLTKLGFALAAYRADHGSYPMKLAELAPKYVAAIPPDIFNGEPLHYKQEGDGYLLYSVGVNGIDDGGKGADDCKNGEKWDDLSLRVHDSGQRKP